MDHDDPTNPVGRVTVHTFSNLSTWNIDVQTLRVNGRCYILDPFHRLLNILHDLVIASHEHHLSRTKIDGIDTVPNPVNIDQFPIHGDSIDTTEEEVRSHL